MTNVNFFPGITTCCSPCNTSRDSRVVTRDIYVTRCELALNGHEVTQSHKLAVNTERSLLYAIYIRIIFNRYISICIKYYAYVI